MNALDILEDVEYNLNGIMCFSQFCSEKQRNNQFFEKC